MGTKKREPKPQLLLSEAIEEIYHRTGLPTAAIKKTLEVYMDIVKECVSNNVEVVFGDIGIFGWKHWPMQLGVEKKNLIAGEKIIVDLPAYDIMSFRQKRQWRKRMKEITMGLYPENSIFELFEGENNELDNNGSD